MKRYTSKQEYAAFYWDGSNVEALQEWLKELGVMGCIEIEGWGRLQGCYFVVKNDGEQQGILNSYPAWVVVSTGIDIVVSVMDVDTFDKFFVEVSE